MAGGLSVTYQDLEAAAQRLSAGQQQIESELQGLKNQIDQLVHGGFVTDSASVQFGASYEEFNTGAKQVIEGLTHMGAYLNKAAATFRDTDAQLASSLKR
jgi:WXG100 family type VII secretion target